MFKPDQSSPAHMPELSFPIYHWSELSKLRRRKYLIKGLLDQGGMSVIYGASNSGKTFIALDIACHIALGWAWQGRKTKRRAVVYIAAEGGLGIVERLNAFRIHKKLEGFADLYIIPSSLTLCGENDDLETLLSCLDAIPNIVLIFVDTVARALGGGNENSSEDMGAFIKNCDLIREHTKAHVSAVHHCGKDEGRGARGHSSLKAAIDTEIYVTQKEGVISAEVTKQRDGKTGEIY